MKKVMYLTTTILYLLCTMSQFSFAQDCIPTVFTYQEADYDYPFTLTSTTDGGYFFTGCLTTEAGDKDLHIMRIDALGNLLWSKNFGGAEDDLGKNTKQTVDGGFIIVGQTKSFSTSGDEEAWMIKTDGDGNEEWSQRYEALEANDIEILPNGKYVIVGAKIVSVSFPAPLIGQGLWMARTDDMGNIEIEATDFANIPAASIFAPLPICTGISITLLEDGSYLLGGGANRDTQTIPRPTYSYTIKASELFEVEWESIAEVTLFSEAFAYKGILHSDGHYYVAEGLGNLSSIGSIQKIALNGTEIWRKFYLIDASASQVVSIRELEDGHLIAGGSSTIFKIDTSGFVLWNSDDIGNMTSARPILDAPDGGFITLSRGSPGTLRLSFLDSLGNSCENRVTGRVYRDNNADCEYNPDEDEALPNSIVYRTPFDLNYSGAPPSNTTPNLTGEYILRVDTGEVEIGARFSSQYIESDMWDLTCPDSTYTLTFPDVDQEEDSIDFAFTPLVSCPLLKVSNMFFQVRPFVESNLYVSVANVGTEDAANVVVDVEIPELLIPDVTGIDLPYTQVGNIFTFTVDTVHWGEQTLIKIPFITDEAAMIGDTVCVRSQIFQDTICGEFMGQGSHVRCRPVTNSYDPNEKILDLASGKNCLEAINEEFFYTIHFQNTGNDTAYQVVIIDSLSSLLDLNTFELLSSSHDVQYDFGAERSLVFTFSDINLLDSLTNEEESQGYVEFSIFPTADFTLEQIIANRAQIYFDYNEPIITEYAYAYGCTEDFLAEIINIEYDFSCEDNYGNLNISAFHPESLLYSIDNGTNWQSSPNFPNLLPANYAICIKSTDGIIVHASENLTDFSSYITPEILNFSTENDTSCEVFNGSIFIETNLEADIEYSINGGVNWHDTSNFTDLRGGIYYLVVRNNEGCESEVQEVTLEGLPYFQLSEIEENIDCTGECNGTITVHVNIANNLTYSLDGVEQPYHVFSNVCAGLHELIITQNDSGCEITRTIGAAPVSVETAPVFCGNELGSIEIILESDIEEVEYSIDNGENWSNSALFENLPSGLFNVFIRDINNQCISEYANNPVTVEEIDEPEITNIFSTNPSNMNNLDGEIIINATGEFPIEYSIDNGVNWQDSNTFLNLSIGDYQPIVRYTNGSCSTESELIVLTSTTSNLEISDANTTFYISPNPFANNFLIECNDENSSNFHFKITDATGKTIMTREVQGVKTLIETENWGKGIYFIYLKKENGYSVQKIVKQ